MLAACERSARVARAFAARGWEAVSCDLDKSEHLPEAYENGGSYQHYCGDVYDLFRWDHPSNRDRWGLSIASPINSVHLWDLVIAFPPCTDLSLAGARFWKDKDITRGGDGRMQEAAAFFMDMIFASKGNDTPCSPRVAVENPIGRMSEWYRYPDQVVEPWWFGDPYIKRTCLWLKNLPLLAADSPVAPVGRVATGGGSWRTDKAAARVAMSHYEDSEGRVNRSVVRSRTMQGFADAMARQWGAYAEKEEGWPG